MVAGGAGRAAVDVDVLVDVRLEAAVGVGRAPLGAGLRQRLRQRLRQLGRAAPAHLHRRRSTLKRSRPFVKHWNRLDEVDFGRKKKEPDPIEESDP